MFELYVDWKRRSVMQTKLIEKYRDGYREYGPYQTDAVLTAMLVVMLMKHPTAVLEEAVKKVEYMGGVDYVRTVTVNVTDRAYFDDYPEAKAAHEAALAEMSGS